MHQLGTFVRKNASIHPGAILVGGAHLLSASQFAQQAAGGTGERVLCCTAGTGDRACAALLGRVTELVLHWCLCAGAAPSSIGWGSHATEPVSAALPWPAAGAASATSFGKQARPQSAPSLSGTQGGEAAAWQHMTGLQPPSSEARAAIVRQQQAVVPSPKAASRYTCMTGRTCKKARDGRTYLGTCAPEEMETYAPEEMGTYAPEEMGTYAPEEMGTCAPEEMGTCAPEEMGTCAPEEMGTCAPEEMGTCAPEVMGTYAPEEMGTCAPEEMGKQQKAVSALPQPNTHLRGPSMLLSAEQATRGCFTLQCMRVCMRWCVCVCVCVCV